MAVSRNIWNTTSTNSRWFRRLAASRHDLPVVSLDGVRGELDVDPADDQGEVVQVCRGRGRELLRSGRSFAFNATNLLRTTRPHADLLFTTTIGCPDASSQRQ